MTVVDLLWLAGVIDATATVTVKHVPHRDPDKPASYRAHVSLTTTARALADTAREIADAGKVFPLARRGEGESIGWRWQADAAQADVVLRAVRPYLRIRTEQADAGIRVQALNAARAPKTPAHLAALDAEFRRATAANAALSKRRGRTRKGPQP
jgi:hypothetical protein